MGLCFQIIAYLFWTHLLCVLWDTGSSDTHPGLLSSSAGKSLFDSKGSPEVTGSGWAWSQRGHLCSCWNPGRAGSWKQTG